jgi:hypothetical protein
MNFKAVIPVLILSLLNFSSFSSEMDLYETQILVKDNDRNNPDYLKLAFAQILSNQSGQPITQVLKNPVFNEVNIRRGIKRSYFNRVPHEYKVKNSEHEYWFHVVMDETFVDKTLMEGQFDLWPDNRQSAVIWLAEERDDQTIEVSLNPKYIYWIKQWAKSHSIEVKTPSHDNFGDPVTINPFMIKNLSHYLIEYSKEALNSDLIAAIYIQPNEDEVKFRYGLSMDQSEYLIRHVSDLNENLASNFYQVIADLAQFQALSERIEHQNVKQHTVQLQILGLQGYQDSLYLKEYLESLSVIEQFEIIKASSNSQTLRVNVKVNNEALIRLIERDGLMSHELGGSIHQLVFEWN